MIAYLLAALDSDEDREYFSNIYEKYHNRMEKIAMRILQSQSDAEDAVQNAFMRIINHFEQALVIPHDELQFWIISIVKNEALMIYRKKQRVVQLDESLDYTSESLEEVQSYCDLVEAFAKLPEIYRIILEMRVLIGYSEKETAKALGISETAVSTRVNRGRALLRKVIEQEGLLYDK